MTDLLFNCDICGKEYAEHECTCGAFLCSKRCILKHTGGLTIQQMRELEKYSNK